MKDSVSTRDSGHSNRCCKDKADIAAAMEAWAAAFSGENTGALLALYADDAVLWGTFSVIRRDTPPAIRDYFEQVFTFTERKATFCDPCIRVYGTMAVSTGSSVYSWVRNGQIETVSARCSIVYVKRKGRWLIVDHHSSEMPRNGTSKQNC